MEQSLTFTTSSSPSRLSCFSSHGVFTQHYQHKSIAPTTLRRKPISVKAIKTTRKTLSTNWDISNSSPQWMPRFEELDTTNMLLRQRIVFLGSQVDDVTADFIISQLLFLDAEDSTKDIKLFINSPGGSVTAGMGIYDAMKMCKADVSTVCLGLAASMGAFLLASGSKGKRYCMPNSRVMIHQPLGTAGEKHCSVEATVAEEIAAALATRYGGDGVEATEMGLRIREMMYHKVKLNKIISRITGKSEEQVEQDTDRDNFMNPWEAKEYGLVDAVIDDGKPGLVAPIGDSSPPPKTKVWDLWKIEGSRKAKKSLPSEERGNEQEKQEPAPV